MKKTLAFLTFSVALASVSNAAVTLSGTALKNVQGTTSSDLVSGRLALLIVDTTGDGFLTGFSTGATASGNAMSGTVYGTTAQAELLATTYGLGGVTRTFGGDTVIARLTTAVAFGDTTISGTLSGFNATPFLNKNYAIVWFNTLTTVGSETVATASTYFGIARGGDWTFPAADSGAYTFGTSGSSLDQITLGAGGSTTAATAAAGQSVSFATAGTSLRFVPEPSAALLGAVGALVLLRRRRN